MTQSAVATAGAVNGETADRVGPNAILQYLPVLEEAVGAAGLRQVLEEARIRAIPDGAEMIAEGEAARFHRAVRKRFPGIAVHLAKSAGSATADYIIAHRIPAIAKAVLPLLPGPVAVSLLCRSVTEHAWTFAGSGAFTAHLQAPLLFEIASNPLACNEQAGDPICHWHAAVFGRLFTRLVRGAYEVIESDCCACGAATCRFQISQVQ